MKTIIVCVMLVVLIGCATSRGFKKDEVLFNSSKTILTFKSVADLNDSYFEVKENNFFEYYRVLYDSVKNSSYPGRYTMVADTMILNFYNKKGVSILARKALIEKNKKEIILFDNFPGTKKRLIIQ